MDIKIITAIQIFDNADDLAKDWYFKTIGLKNEDRTIAKAYYSKACKERQILAKRLFELTREGVKNE